ncbi:MAG: GDSL-type esterase/lipase family protein [Candidatus Bathyarchaeum tardum]|nr:MAG: GDSL-type esterase/lipase family protein [Candidatus Bathyarchaeum tardum]
MNKQKLQLLAIGILILFVTALVAQFFIMNAGTKQSTPEAIKVACVGDSLTQSTVYPLVLWINLGLETYDVQNFGVGSTTVILESETPYMDTPTFQEALDFQPDIVILLIGTNDAQPSLFPFNTTFVSDYLELVSAFQGLSSNPEIWIVLPPPLFGDKGGTISPEYFANTIIPLIKQVANQTNLPTIDVYSALSDASEYFPDGLHPNVEGGTLIAEEIYKALAPN